jgi:hypothetical protein
MLLKVLIATFFYNDRTTSRLRTYFICRYAYNVFVFSPAMLILRLITHTYLQNYFLVGGLLILFELMVGSFYICNLYKKMPHEIFEDIPTVKSELFGDATTHGSKKPHRAVY